MRTEARFPHVERKDGHYESFYLKACRPGGGLGVWIRHTVHKRPGADPTAALWFTLFDAEAEGPLAAKASFPAGELSAGGGAYIAVGGARLEPGRAAGSLSAGGLEASWELGFEGTEAPLRHLPRGWMYRAPVPRTKLLSPHPAVAFGGTLRAGGREIAVEGWPGMIGHNWGAQHAERWIWLHGAGFEGRPGAWLDVALGRIKLGPFTTPWVANGCLALDGRRHALGGIERTRRTEVAERPTGCELVLPGKDATVRGRVGAGARDFAGWIYADPDGSEHNTLNCSIADLELEVERPGLPAERLTATGAAAYEIGMRERDHGIPIQPFPDG